MAWRYDLPKCPVSPADRGEFMKPKVDDDKRIVSDKCYCRNNFERSHCAYFKGGYCGRKLTTAQEKPR